MAHSTRIGVFFGIPVRVHISLWILLPLISLRLAPLLGSFFWGLLAALGLFASVALHEIGHSRMAISKGCRVRDILLLPIGGMARLEGLPRRPLDEFLVAASGPAVSLLLGLSLLLLKSLAQAVGWNRLGWFFLTLGAINLMLVVFNLLPAFPMDGGRIFRAWMTPRLGRVEATRRAAMVGRFMAVGFVLLALWGRPVNWILIVIAVFVYTSAGQEYRLVLRQESYERSPFGSLFGEEDSSRVSGPFAVSAPPYERQRGAVDRWKEAARDFFNGLFRPRQR